MKICVSSVFLVVSALIIFAWLLIKIDALLDDIH